MHVAQLSLYSHARRYSIDIHSSLFVAALSPIKTRVQIFYFFEVAKMITAAIALATQGSDSEVVRLSVKAFRKHFTLLGALLGLNSPHQEHLSSPPSSISSLCSVSPGLATSKPAFVCADGGVLRTALVSPAATVSVRSSPLKHVAMSMAVVVAAVAAAAAVSATVA